MKEDRHFDPEKLRRDKQLAREKGDADLREGRVTAEELRLRNGLFSGIDLPRATIRLPARRTVRRGARLGEAEASRAWLPCSSSTPPLEQMLMRLFEINDSQRAALRGRFRYIRPRVLGKEPIGRGIARYELDDILRIVLVLELEDAGYSPTHAIRIVKNHWTDLQGYFGDAWDAMRARESGGTAEGVLAAVVPHLLREMGTGTSDEAIALNELAGELEVPDVVGWPVAALGGHRHATSINLPSARGELRGARDDGQQCRAAL